MRKILEQAVEALQECANTYNHDKTTQEKMLFVIAAASVKLAETGNGLIGYANIEELDRLKSPAVSGRPVFVSKEPGKGRMAIYSEPRQIGWQPIETIPHFKFVQAYCEKYHKGTGKEKNGVMVVCYKPATGTRPAEFADDFGIAVNWDFSRWMPLPDAPNGEKSLNYNETLQQIAPYFDKSEFEFRGDSDE
jgi:hypothetical protein